MLQETILTTQLRNISSKKGKHEEFMIEVWDFFHVLILFFFFFYAREIINSGGTFLSVLQKTAAHFGWGPQQC